MPTPKPKPVIPVRVTARVKQMDLADILGCRDHLAELRRAVKAAEEDLAKREALTLYALDHGAAVEAGRFAVALVEELGARRPAWKDELARRCGAQVVEDIIAATPVPTRRVLTITEPRR